MIMIYKKLIGPQTGAQLHGDPTTTSGHWSDDNDDDNILIQ